MTDREKMIEVIREWSLGAYSLAEAEALADKFIAAGFVLYEGLGKYDEIPDWKKEGWVAMMESQRCVSCGGDGVVRNFGVKKLWKPWKRCERCGGSGVMQ